MGIVAMLYDQTGETESGKSKIAASKLEIRLSQLVHKIAAKSQHIYLGSWGSAIQWQY